MRWPRLLSALALLGLSCGTTPRCADTCAGCCDAKDVCKPGTSHGLCGLGGALCLACPASDVCTGGACSSPPCGPSNCQGCCDASSGRCQVSAISSACGLGGVACAQCSSNQRCDNGACVNCLVSGSTCSSDASCCSQLCDGLTGFTPGGCH